MSEATLTLVADVARPVYRKHAEQFGTCACSTCTIARILWPSLADREQERADAAVLSDPAASVASTPPGATGGATDTPTGATP